jgi:hypothetical protein
MKAKNIPIALDEWVPGGAVGGRASMFAALSSAETLHELFRYSNSFLMSAFTSAPGCLVINKTDVAMAAGRADVQVVPAAFWDDSSGREREFSAARG